MLSGLREDTLDFRVLDACWLSSSNCYSACWSMSLEFREDLEAGIVNLRVLTVWNHRMGQGDHIREVVVATWCPDCQYSWVIASYLHHCLGPESGQSDQ